MLLAPMSVAAQTTAPDVEVNLGTLDTLAPAPAKPGAKRIVLHPPDETPREAKPRKSDTPRKTQPAADMPEPAAKPTPSLPPPSVATLPVSPPPPPPPPMPVVAPPPPLPVIPPIALAATPPHPALPPLPETVPGSQHLIFARDAATLDDKVKHALDGLAKELAAKPGAHLAVIGYAAGDDDHVGEAHRLSLSRALAVRSYLIQRGVRNSRLDLRARGHQNDGDGPPDRVDVTLLDP